MKFFQLFLVSVWTAFTNRSPSWWKPASKRLHNHAHYHYFQMIRIQFPNLLKVLEPERNAVIDRALENPRWTFDWYARQCQTLRMQFNKPPLVLPPLLLAQHRHLFKTEFILWRRRLDDWCFPFIHNNEVYVWTKVIKSTSRFRHTGALTLYNEFWCRYCKSVTL